METGKRALASGFAAAVLMMLLAAPSWAFVTESLQLGVVVPYALYDDTGRDTVVGIIVPDNPGGKIYWTFIDANGNRLASDSIPLMTTGIAYSFSLSAALRGRNGAPDVGKGVSGYLVMIRDNNGTLQTTEMAKSMAANAFLVNLNDSDAVFLPVIPLGRDDLVNADIDLLNFPPDALLHLFSAEYSVSVWIRFLTGPGGDPSTLLVVFSPTDAPSSFEAQAYSIDGTVLTGLKIPAPARRLNLIDVGSISGLAVNEGYLSLTLPATTDFGAVFAFTRASAVGAAQTVIGIE